MDHQSKNEKLERLHIGDMVKTKSGIVGVVASIYNEFSTSSDKYKYLVAYESEALEQATKDQHDKITVSKMFDRQELTLLRPNDIPTGRIIKYGFGI